MAVAEARDETRREKQISERQQSRRRRLENMMNWRSLATARRSNGDQLFVSIG